MVVLWCAFWKKLQIVIKGVDNNLPTASVLHGLQSLGWVVKKLGRSRKG